MSTTEPLHGEPARVAAITLAAGLGTRMRSARAKVLHELAGQPMIISSLRPLVAFGADPVIVVVGHQAEQVEAVVRDALDGATTLKFALQAVQRGTGHAALCAMECVAADFDGDVIITYGDMPRLRAATISAFIGRTATAAPPCLSSPLSWRIRRPTGEWSATARAT